MTDIVVESVYPKGISAAGLSTRKQIRGSLMRRTYQSCTFVLVAVASFQASAEAQSPVNAESSPLRRKISLKVKARPLEDVLVSLEREGAPIRLRAVRHLRERRMTLLAKDETFGEIMGAIAELWSLPHYPATWIKLSQNRGYELSQRPEAALEGLRREAADRKIMAECLAKLKDLPPDDENGNTQSISLDPRMSSCNKGWAVAAGAMLRELPPDALERAARGEHVPVPTPMFSPVTRELLFRNTTANHRKGKIIPGVPVDFNNPATLTFESPEEQRQRFDTEPIAIVLRRDEVFGKWSPALSTGSKDRATDIGTGGTPIGFSEDLKKAERNKKSSDRRPEKLTPITAEQRKAISDAVAEGAVKDMAQFEELLHRVTHRLVVGDYYSKWQGFGQPFQAWITEALRKNTTLEGFLESFTPEPRYRHRRRGEALAFRSRMWWIDDEAEIPLEVTRKLTKGYKERGYMNLDELALAALLSEKQLKTLRIDYLPEPPVEVVESIQPWLQLYANVPPAYRAQMQRAPGILLGELPETQLNLLNPTNRPAATEGRFKVPRQEVPGTRVYLYQEAAQHPTTKMQTMRTWVHLTWPSRPEGRRFAATQVLPQSEDKVPRKPGAGTEK